MQERTITKFAMLVSPSPFSATLWCRVCLFTLAISVSLLLVCSDNKKWGGLQENFNFKRILC
jgi:hypothetical protein